MALSESELAEILGGMKGAGTGGWLVSAHNSVRIRVDQLTAYYTAKRNTNDPVMVCRGPDTESLLIIFKLFKSEFYWSYPPTDEGHANRKADFAMIDRAMGVSE